MESETNANIADVRKVTTSTSTMERHSLSLRVHTFWGDFNQSAGEDLIKGRQNLVDSIDEAGDQYGYDRDDGPGKCDV